MSNLESHGLQLLINNIFGGEKERVYFKAVQSFLLAVYLIIAYQKEQMVQVALGDPVVLEVPVVHQVLGAQE